MSTDPQMTVPTLKVLRILVDDPTHEHYGWELCQAAGLPSGTVYPILARLEEAGWLTSAKEIIDPAGRTQQLRRPRRPRRFYRLTAGGAERARQALVEAQRAIWPAAHPSPGFMKPGGATA